MQHEGEWKVTNVNTRVEKAGEDDGDIAVDVNVENIVHRSTVKAIFDNHQLDALLAGLYDEGGHVLNAGVVAIKLDNEFTGGIARIETGLNEFAVLRDARVCKFVVKPQGSGTLEMKFQIQGHPSDGDIEALAKVQKQMCRVKLGDFVSGGKKPTPDCQGDMLEGNEDLDQAA